MVLILVFWVCYLACHYQCWGLLKQRHAGSGKLELTLYVVGELMFAMALVAAIAGRFKGV
jgi:hypothetical protein